MSLTADEPAGGGCACILTIRCTMHHLPARIPPPCPGPCQQKPPPSHPWPNGSRLKASQTMMRVTTCSLWGSWQLRALLLLTVMATCSQLVHAQPGSTSCKQSKDESSCRRLASAGCVWAASKRVCHHKGTSASSSCGQIKDAASCGSKAGCKWSTTKRECYHNKGTSASSSCGQIKDARSCGSKAGCQWSTTKRECYHNKGTSASSACGQIKDARSCGSKAGCQWSTTKRECYHNKGTSASSSCGQIKDARSCGSKAGCQWSTTKRECYHNKGTSASSSCGQIKDAASCAQKAQAGCKWSQARRACYGSTAAAAAPAQSLRPAQAPRQQRRQVAKVSLAVDISSYNADPGKFQRNFAAGIATALSITPARVIIVNVQPGSVAVEFYIAPAAGAGELSAEAAMAKLASSAQNPQVSQSFAQVSGDLGSLTQVSVESRPVPGGTASAPLRTGRGGGGDSSGGGAAIAIGAGVALLMLIAVAVTLLLRKRPTKRPKPSAASPVVVQGRVVENAGEWRQSTEFNSLTGDLSREDFGHGKP
jgi:hypothetical protein